MKTHYERIEGKWRYNRWTKEVYFDDFNIGRYEHRYAYWRAIRTFNEYRQNRCAIADGYKVRGARRNLPSLWDDKHVSRAYGRSWKDYTKKKRQYKTVLNG